MRDELEHDTYEEFKDTKAMPKPTENKMIINPALDKIKQTREKMRYKRKKDSQPWLHYDNPAVWNGSILED